MTATKEIRAFKGMTIRNMKVYGKDKISLLLSMLTQLIVLGLFVLFLKGNYVDVINQELGDLKGLLSKDDINSIVNSWLVSGVAGTAVVTSALNALSVMVHDKMDRIDYDYTAAAIKNRTVVMSYFTGAMLSAVVTSSILLTAGLGYLAVSGSFLLSALDIIMLYGIVVLGSISSTLVLMLFISFLKKDSSLSAFGILISVAIGFVVGAYMPVGQFSQSVQTVVNLVPGAHITALLRNVLMQPAINHADSVIGGADNHAFAKTLDDLFSMKLHVFNGSHGTNFMIIYSLAAIALFLVLNILIFRVAAKKAHNS